jgi:uncharacterized iron-regulated membrane protein
VNWDTQVGPVVMPLWLCIVIVAVTGSITAWLMWTDRRKLRRRRDG